MTSTRFEDERNDIREYYFFDAEMNRVMLDGYTAQVEPESYVARKGRSKYPYEMNREAQAKPVILDVGFYFKKETTSPMNVVFWFRVSHKGYQRKGETGRTYTGERSEEGFNSYSSQYLQSARTCVIQACNEQAVISTTLRVPIDVAVFVSRVYYQILLQWSILK